MICVHQAFSVLSISQSIIASMAFPHRLTLSCLNHSWRSQLALVLRISNLLCIWLYIVPHSPSGSLSLFLYSFIQSQITAHSFSTSSTCFPSCSNVEVRIVHLFIIKGSVCVLSSIIHVAFCTTTLFGIIGLGITFLRSFGPILRGGSSSSPSGTWAGFAANTFCG